MERRRQPTCRPALLSFHVEGRLINFLPMGMLFLYSIMFKYIEGGIEFLNNIQKLGIILKKFIMSMLRFRVRSSLKEILRKKLSTKMIKTTTQKIDEVLNLYL
jgi:hypothetical protein